MGNIYIAAYVTFLRDLTNRQCVSIWLESFDADSNSGTFNEQMYMHYSWQSHYSLILSIWCIRLRQELSVLPRILMNSIELFQTFPEIILIILFVACLLYQL